MMHQPSPSRSSLPLADLSRYACRWPVNDAKPAELHLFCGQRTEGTKPYCKAHCLLAYRKRGAETDAA
ncbi:hypothetical protein KYK29_20805 [Shinella daejeonensis]|nr:hypothetical protein [Shinella daejeonensis]